MRVLSTPPHPPPPHPPPSPPPHPCSDQRRSPRPLWLSCSDLEPPSPAELQSWVAEGDRKELIDDETEHVEPSVLAAILRAKTALDHIQDRRAFNDARTRANPFEGLKKEFFVNRAALKMAAMDAAFDGLFSFADAADPGTEAVAAAQAVDADVTNGAGTTARPAPGLLCFGDVAAGPGGFSEYLLWRRGGSAKGFGFTLRGDHDFETHKFYYRAPPELFHAYYGERNDGDLYVSNNIRSFRQLIDAQTDGGMLHCVMADGGFDVSGLENIQEVMNKQLLLTQFAAGLCTLRTGGHFVCKTFDLFTPFSVGLLCASLPSLPPPLHTLSPAPPG